MAHESTSPIIVVNAGDDPDTPRPAAATVYWKCDAGVTPANAQPGDMIFNADA